MPDKLARRVAELLDFAAGDGEKLVASDGMDRVIERRSLRLLLREQVPDRPTSFHRWLREAADEEADPAARPPRGEPDPVVESPEPAPANRGERPANERPQRRPPALGRARRGADD